MGDIYTRKGSSANPETARFEKSVLGATGQPSDLDTDDVGNLVTAINELLTKQGAIGDLTTSEKSSVVLAINELVTSISGVSLAALLAKESGVLEVFRVGAVTLRGTQTSVLFQAATTPTLTGSATAPFDFSSPGDGGTLVIDIDVAGDATMTINAAAGTSTGDNSSPSQDMSGEIDTKFKISVDGDVAEEVTCDWSGANSGANIAAEMQTVVRALSGNKTLVTVVWSTDHYLFTSSMLGTDSAVVITPGATLNCTEELEIGVSGGATEVGGTGDVADLAAVTIAELIAVYDTDIASGTMTDDGSDHVLITSPTDGYPAAINVNASSTLETILGLATTIVRGVDGLDYGADMGDANYKVFYSFSGTTGGNLGGNQVGTSNKATNGFIIECEDSGADDTIDLIIAGILA